MPYPARMVTARASTAVSGRDAVIADRSLGGRELCRALSAATDDMLVGPVGRGRRPHHPRRRKSAVALVAVGGYGRGELAPYSDVDVVLVHDGKPDGIEQAATALWYPLWDAGLKLGHAVRSLDDQLALAGDDLDTATSLLSARYLAGDEELAGRLATEGLARWRRHGRRWLDALRARGARAPRPGRRRRVPARARPEGRPRRDPRRADAVVGRRRRPRRARPTTSPLLDALLRHARRRPRRPAPVHRARRRRAAPRGPGRRGRGRRRRLGGRR